MGIVQAPPGSSLAYTTALADRAQAIIYRTRTSMAHVRSWVSASRGTASNAGMMFISTKPAAERRGKGHSAADIVADLAPKLQRLMFQPDGGLVRVIQPPAVQGVGSYGGFQFMLQDTGVNTLSDLDRVAHQIVTRAGAQGSYRACSRLSRQTIRRCWSRSIARRRRRWVFRFRRSPPR